MTGLQSTSTTLTSRAKNLINAAESEDLEQFCNTLSWASSVAPLTPTEQEQIFAQLESSLPSGLVEYLRYEVRLMEAVIEKTQEWTSTHTMGASRGEPYD